MFRNYLNRPKKHDFTNCRFTHYIVTTQELREDELELLGQLLASFPHAGNDRWPEEFAALNLDNISKKILTLAANAYDPPGNTMLGVAAQRGNQIEALQRLIEMGADLDIPDDNMKKLALHWAINNRLSNKDKNSYEAVKAVQCLLDNGARTDIVCYRNETLLEYAESRGFAAAATLIRESMQKKPGFEV